jgi:hypothetical protein
MSRNRRPDRVARHCSVALPLIFLFGPSGAGKSSLAAAIRGGFGALYLELDRYPQDGIDLEELRTEWDAFWIHGEAHALASEIRRRVEAATAAGAVLSFPSGVILSDGQIGSSLLREAVTPVVLYGPREQCLQAFLTRERATGRNLPANHWIANSAHAHAEFGASRFKRFRVEAFARGSFRSIADIAAEVWQRASMRVV